MSADLTPEEVAAFENCEAEHGEVWYLKTKTAFVVFRCPKPIELKRLKALVADERKDANAKADADVGLAKDVVVWPPKAEFEELIKRRPMITARVVGEALLVAADEETKEAKKLDRG